MPDRKVWESFVRFSKSSRIYLKKKTTLFCLNIYSYLGLNDTPWQVWSDHEVSCHYTPPFQHYRVISAMLLFPKQAVGRTQYEILSYKNKKVIYSDNTVF